MAVSSIDVLFVIYLIGGRRSLYSSQHRLVILHVCLQLIILQTLYLPHICCLSRSSLCSCRLQRCIASTLRDCIVFCFRVCRLRRCPIKLQGSRISGICGIRVNDNCIFSGKCFSWLPLLNCCKNLCSAKQPQKQKTAHKPETKIFCLFHPLSFPLLS